jgi:hypothetical protein
MKKKLITCITFLVVILTNCILHSEATDTGGFTYSLEIYPAKITLHELIYIRLTLENKTDETLEGRKYVNRDTTCLFRFVGDKEEDVYFYPFRIGLNVFIPPPGKILSNERFTPVNSFIEFPEILTLKDYRRELNSANNANFIKNYVDSGKKCKLVISLRDTGRYSSDEFEITSRPAKEMLAIKKWHSQFSNFLADTHRISETSGDNLMTGEKWQRIPKVKDFRNFESQLSDGTLKNFVKFRRLLATIPEEKNRPPKLPTLEITKPYRDLDDYLGTLHPFEQDILILEAINYFRESEDIGNALNHFRMLYLLIPKLPKSEREKYIHDIPNEEYQNILLNSPEPANKTEQNLSTSPSLPPTITSTSLSHPPILSPQPQIGLTEPLQVQPKNGSTPFLQSIAILIVILFVLFAVGIIIVRKILYK